MEEKEIKDFLESVDKKNIETAVQDALDWLERNPTAGAEELQAKLKEVDSTTEALFKKAMEKAHKYYYEKHQEELRFWQAQEGDQENKFTTQQGFVVLSAPKKDEPLVVEESAEPEDMDEFFSAFS